MLLEQWGVSLAVLGMLLLMLSMAAVMSLYQAHLAAVRGAVRHLDAGAEKTSAALQALGHVPLSRELRLTLRSDMLARYQKIRGLYRRYPGIAERIRLAENDLDTEGAPAPGGVGPIESEQEFRTTIAALDRLMASFGQGGTLQPVPADVCQIFRRELGERRAEVMSRFHLVEARRQDQRGNSTRARTHLMALIQALRQYGPKTGFVRALYAEAESALSALDERQLNQVIGVGDSDAA